MHLSSFFTGLFFGFLSLFGISHSPIPPTTTPVLETASTSMTTSNTHTTTATSAVTSEHQTNDTQATDSGTQETETKGLAAHYATFDIHAIPLGDGNVSTSPKAGYVYSCTTSFRGGGAMHSGDWIQGATWDMSKKIAVEGTHYWSDATFSDVVSNTVRTLSGNGLPVKAPTGTFPVQQSDPAWQYDRNPNSIGAYTVAYSLPAKPTFAKSPSCLPLGQIGYALNGVALFNALDDAGRDAVAHEVQDSCDGHPQGSDIYHYHGPSTCMPDIDAVNTVVGFALDGFPITSMFDANHHYYTNADLDACHGMTSTYTDENGTTQHGYHYVMTQEYPYMLGCFMGTPVSAHNAGGGAQSTPSPSAGTSGPPQAALTACSALTLNASCSFSTPNGTVSGTCKMPPGSESLACVP